MNLKVVGIWKSTQRLAGSWEVLERGEAVAIFPEGITHDDPQLKTVKTGSARMVLEWSIATVTGSACRSCPWG